MEKIKEIIEKNSLGRYDENITFSMITTLKVGGKIRLIFYPQNIRKLVVFINLIKDYTYPILIIGSGSNILASDNIYEGIVISFKDFSKKIKIDNNIITVYPNCKASRLSCTLSLQGYQGAEFLIGIPGEMGGILAMNAGSFNDDISNHVKRVLCLSLDKKTLEYGKIRWYDKEELDFEYRNSKILKNGLVVLKAELYFEKGDDYSLIKDKLRKIILERKEKQPITLHSAGCAFMNPHNNKAWKLIDEAGLKGVRYGGAEVSNVHGNFIVNLGNATASDLFYLVNYVQNKVYENSGILLKNEWIIINF